MGGYGSSYSYDDNEAITRRSASSYNVDFRRTYSVKTALPPPIKKNLVTEVKFPLVVAVDVTASMRELPGIIFEKLCILYNEARFFLPDSLKDSLAISFAAIGDAYADSHPLQVTDFAEGNELDNNIKALYPEGGGGGLASETYELAAYFYARHCQMPGNKSNDPKPLLIFVGDEDYYPDVNRKHVKKLIGDDLPADLPSNDIFNELREKFNVYILRVKYRGMVYENSIHESWKKALGPDKVILMKDPRRIIDTILGLIAAHVDHFDGFRERIEVRQTPEQINQVFKSLDGVKEENKKYVYEFQTLTCSNCGGPLKKAPEYNKPTPCDHCDILLVRI